MSHTYSLSDLFHRLGSALDEPILVKAAPFVDTWAATLEAVGYSVSNSKAWAFYPYDRSPRFYYDPDVVILAYLMGKPVEEAEKMLGALSPLNEVKDHPNYKTLQEACRLATEAMLETTRHLCMASELFPEKNQ